MGIISENAPDLDVEAFVDGNLNGDLAARFEAELHQTPTALETMFAVARLNAALRKARSAVRKDPALSIELQKYRERRAI